MKRGRRYQTKRSANMAATRAGSLKRIFQRCIAELSDENQKGISWFEWAECGYRWVRMYVEEPKNKKKLVARLSMQYLQKLYDDHWKRISE